MLHVKVLTTTNQWDELAEEWDVLLSQTLHPNVFLTFEWLRTWWDYYSSHKELHILIAVNENNIITGIAPFYISHESKLSIKIRAIRFLSDQNVGSDFLNFIIKPENIFETLIAFVDYLLTDDKWDLICLDAIDGQSQLYSIFKTKMEQQGLVAHSKLQNICPYLVIPANDETFSNQPDKLYKKIIKKKLITIQKRYPAMKMETISNSKEGLDDIIEHFFALHKQRWGLVGQGGSFIECNKRKFYQKLMECMANKGWLYLSYLSIGDAIEAMDFTIKYNNTCFFLQSGCSENALKYNGGNILLYWIFAETIKQGVHTFEFLRGDELYKYYWGCENRYTIRLLMANTFKGRAVCAFQILIKNFRTIAKFLLGKNVKSNLSEIIKSLTSKLQKVFLKNIHSYH